jgi:hypothetical protein
MKKEDRSHGARWDEVRSFCPPIFLLRTLCLSHRDKVRNRTVVALEADLPFLPFIVSLSNP